jgi:hypothetical protein
MRLQREGTIEALERAFMVANASGKPGVIVVCGCEAGIERNSLLKARQCVSGTPDRVQRHAKVRVCRGVLGSEAYRLAVVRQRLLPPSERRQCGPSRTVSTRKGLIQCKRAITAAQRLLFPSERAQCLGEVQENGWTVGLEFQRTRQETGAAQMISELPERDTEKLHQIWIIGSPAQQILVSRYRLAQAPCAMVAYG